ncbi:MAG: translational GTPase TypA [Deltaproteobacteria bacterium]|jgi:GTP-binding protein|nr:translational GTPase TypA [Deltaproteobacteria bacterium]
MDLRNIAIIAHVDHGKTTLVDGLLKQSGTLRDKGDANERVMDFNDQEKERGITITAKNTAVTWNGYRINIVDTPGHSDFGSEVERVLRMVDGVLLLVDAAEGPMPQTRFVLRKSLELGLKALVCINKIDRKDARPKEVLDEVFDLFVSLGANDEQLDFPVIYAVGRDGWAVKELGKTSTDLKELFEFIVEHIPAPTSDPTAPLQMQVATLAHSPFLGRIAVGRIYAGHIKRGMQATVCRPDGSRENFRVTQLMTFKGLERIDCDEATAGDIIALAGAGDATVGDTVCLAAQPLPMAAIPIDPPTMSMTFSPNSSPFGGREGKFVTSRQIRDRLDRELLSNVGLRVEQGSSMEQFVVSGRGTLHLSVLIETMRREGFELSVSPPQVITRVGEDGRVEEPIEEVAIDCAEPYSGSVIEKLNQRGGELLDLQSSLDGHVRMRWYCPSQGLIGYRSEYLTDTRGTGTIMHLFSHYAPSKGKSRMRKNGVLIVQDDGETITYSLNTLQERGVLFTGPGEKVYHGQIIGLHARENDLVVNPSKAKKLTNIRSSGNDENIFLTPPRTFSLEEALEFIGSDELVEVTPKHIRLRKKYLDHNERKRFDKTG